jgi:hypothetical protein
MQLQPTTPAELDRQNKISKRPSMSVIQVVASHNVPQTYMNVLLLQSPLTEHCCR